MKKIIAIVCTVFFASSLSYSQTNLAELMDTLASDIESAQTEFLTGKKTGKEILQELKQGPDSMFLEIAQQEVQKQIDNAGKYVGTMEFASADVVLGEATTEYGKDLLNPQKVVFKQHVKQAWHDYLDFRDDASTEAAKQKAAKNMQQKMSQIHGSASVNVFTKWKSLLYEPVPEPEPEIVEPEPESEPEPEPIMYLPDAQKAMKAGSGREAIRLGELAYQQGEAGSCEFLEKVYRAACKKLKGKKKREIKKKLKALDCY